MGIEDIGSFNYRDLIRATGFTTLESYTDGTRRNEIPLRDEFLVYQRDAAADFVRQLGLIADSITGVPVPVGVNAWNLIPTQLSTSHHADYFANEVSHIDVEDLIPVSTFEPICRFITDNSGLLMIMSLSPRWVYYMITLPAATRSGVSGPSAGIYITRTYLQASWWQVMTGSNTG